MPRDLKTFIPTAEELLNLELPRLGEILLMHLNSWKGEGKVWQMVGLNRLYFIQVMEGTARGLGPLPRNEPEYGANQPQVTRRMQEAWNWLVKEGLLMHNPDQPRSDWFLITTEGEKLLQCLARYEKWEKLGVDRVKSDLMHTGGIRDVGGTPDVKEMAWEWVRMKENKPLLKRAAASDWELIDDSRLAELRALKSSLFDFEKLIRLCEELNIASREDCYFSIGMLTRGLLDPRPYTTCLRSEIIQRSR